MFATSEWPHLDIERKASYVLTPNASATYHTPFPSPRACFKLQPWCKYSWYEVMVVSPLLTVFARVRASCHTAWSLMSRWLSALDCFKTTPFVMLHWFLITFGFCSALVSLDTTSAGAQWAVVGLQVVANIWECSGADSSSARVGSRCLLPGWSWTASTPLLTSSRAAWTESRDGGELPENQASKR